MEQEQELEQDYLQNQPYYDKDPVQRIIYKNVISYKGGCIIGVSGRANSGKSHTSFGIILRWLRGKVNIKDVVCSDIEDVFENSFKNLRIGGRIFSKDDFQNIPDGQIDQWLEDNIKDISHIRPGNCILVDEAGVSIYNRDFFSADNKAISKLVQIWRFMRMVVIFVVPERFEFVEKTMREFMDMQIVMNGINRKEGYAAATVKERKGRNWRTGEPVFLPVEGCRDGGEIMFLPLSKERAHEYDKASNIWKTKLSAKSFYELLKSNDKTQKSPKENTINEYIYEARLNKDILQNENKKTHEKKYDEFLIQNKFGVSLWIAKRIRAQLELEERTGREDKL